MMRTRDNINLCGDKLILAAFFGIYVLEVWNFDKILKYWDKNIIQSSTKLQFSSEQQ